MVSYQAFKPFKKNPQRITELDKEFTKKLDYSGITFPVTIKQISQIERQNEININLFGYDSERKSVYPIRVSREHYHDHLELLYIEEEAKLEEERNGLPCAVAKQPSDRKSYTEKYQRHTACSFGYKVVCHYDKKFSKDVVIYRGEDCIGEFMKSMFEEVENCQKIIRENFNKPLQMTNRDEKAFKKATHCHICRRKYRPDGDSTRLEENIPVRDHCHITGKYRG